MYEILLPIHIALGVSTIASTLLTVFSKNISFKIFIASIVGVSATGVIMMFNGSSSLWVCVRLLSLVVIAATFRLFVNHSLVRD